MVLIVAGINDEPASNHTFCFGRDLTWSGSQLLSVGLGAFALGIPWYMVLAKPWMKAAGISDEQASNANPIIYMITLFMWIVSSFFLQRYLMQDATSSG